MTYTNVARWDGPMRGHQLLENSYLGTTLVSSGSHLASPATLIGSVLSSDPWYLNYTVTDYLRAYDGFHLGTAVVFFPEIGSLPTETITDEETGDSSTVTIPSFAVCEMTLPYRPERPQNSMQMAIELTSTDGWRLRPRDSILEGISIYLQITAS